MKNTTRTYVLTLNSPSQKAPRLWAGTSIHALRHCSAKQVEMALTELRQGLDDLQRPTSSPKASYSLNRGR
jgi:hypothetical protein